MWIGEELLAVTVYKKGARAVAELVERLGAGASGKYSEAVGAAGGCSDEHFEPAALPV